MIILAHLFFRVSKRVVPIYEYACKACEHEFETLQKISEAPLVECPQCGEAELRKKVSAAAFRLKGGGWYETDFKSGDKKNLAGEHSADKSSSGGSDAGSGKGSSPAAQSADSADSAKSTTSDTGKPPAKSGGDASTPNGKGESRGANGSKSPA